MGIIEKTSSNIKYMHVSCGSLKYKDNGEPKEARGYEGKLVNIVYDPDNEYEGKKIPQYKIYMQDDNGDAAVITFGEDTYYYKGFFSRITEININEPFILGVTNSSQNEKISFCFLKQNGVLVKPNETFPDPEKVQYGNTVVNNWEKVNKRVSEILASMQDLNKVDNSVDLESNDLPF